MTICTGQHLGTLKPFVLTANIKWNLVPTRFSYFSVFMLEACFLMNPSKFLSCREMWWVDDGPLWLYGVGGKWEGSNGQSLFWELGTNIWHISSAHSEAKSTGSCHFLCTGSLYLCSARNFFTHTWSPDSVLSSVAPFSTFPSRASHSWKLCCTGCAEHLSHCSRLVTWLILKCSCLAQWPQHSVQWRSVEWMNEWSVAGMVH